MHVGFSWENPERKRPLGRPRRRWEDNIKMDLREIGWDSMDWIDLAQDRDHCTALANAVMSLRGFIKCWEILECLYNWRLSRRTELRAVSLVTFLMGPRHSSSG
jgi:hypothetical protein